MNGASRHSNLFLAVDVRPGQLLLELVGLGLLRNRLLRLLPARTSLDDRLFEVRDNLSLALQDFVRLADVLHTGLILFAELAELSALQEKLRRVLGPGQRVVYDDCTLYLSAGVDALKNCLHILVSEEKGG